MDIEGEDFFKYFYNNVLTNSDAIVAVVTPLLKDGVYDPMFASLEGLRKQIEFLIK